MLDRGPMLYYLAYCRRTGGSSVWMFTIQDGE